MSVRTANISVSGMSCASCASSIEDAVTKRPGVDAADVNFATGGATVEYDPAKGSLAQIYEAVEAAGYEPERATATVGIAGMSCASCATSTTEAIEAVPGVLGADVNVATDEATVIVNPNDASMAAVYDAVEAAGYEPDRPEANTDTTGPAADRERAVERELRTKRRWVIVGGLLTAPFLLVMAEMLLGASLFLPAWVDWVEFGLATALIGTLGRHFLAGAYTAASNGRANMDTLVAVGTTTGYLYSAAVLASIVTGGLYFEAVAFVLWFIYVGEYLEVRSKARASDALRELLELQAEEATVVEWETDTAKAGTQTPAPGDEQVVPVEAVTVGDVLKVRPGGRIPTDGTVVGGQSGVDESMVTGESVPVDKTPGDEVLGGTINEGGVLYVEATSVGEDTAIRQIVQRVKEAQSRQPDVQRLVDRVSAYFVPAV
ncbi:MAG: cation transport ATPase, partial [halophilic archaeon J07HX5]